MSPVKKIEHQFVGVLEEFLSCDALRKLTHGELTVNHYKWILRQIFHHARENPQIQSLATTYFRGKHRGCVRQFYTHAVSEIGHDQLALNDLAVLGEDTSNIPFENPLPDTSALLAFAFYQIQFRNPIGYLGYLYFLEFTPTASGVAIISALENLGVPKEATSFLEDHTTIDVGHNKLMQGYLETLVTCEQDLESVLYAMQVTGRLYANMLDGAVAQATRNQDFGVNFSELNSSGRPAVLPA
ncbi:MAG: iron-containing redox enzyme family protein [Lysobacterales bacterium]